MIKMKVICKSCKKEFIVEGTIADICRSCFEKAYEIILYGKKS